ncbi:aminotransferase class I/II-fold pyridoxal phosphate-dependent enzyme [Flaviflexus huanghaiensis]|uniref:aminotransferase class I/II-fold pyridoxal phosphate-dependent enzyme n=1 Tax=Flaviflexus huanghaiensis TaxID=1111473 RepID=UPI0019D67376
MTQLEEDAIVRAFRSGWIAPLGPEVDAFEEELAAYCDRKYAVALSSGTAAIHLGLLALGVVPGDLVLTSTMTFAATANAITYTGAEPIFVDCDETGNMDPDLLRTAFETLRSEGKTVKAVVPVDLLGKVVDHDRIGVIAREFGAVVLSDAAESLGARYKGRSSAAYGDVAAVSFNGNKIMTTSGGGALLTDDADLAQHVRYLATQARQPVLHYEHTDIGYNYRMSNLLAAIGRAQLSRLDEMMRIRRENRQFYTRLVEDLRGVCIFGEPSGIDDDWTHDNWWLTSLLIDSDVAVLDREAVVSALSDEDIEARPLWKPMHVQPIFSVHRRFVDGAGESLFRAGVSLPSGSSLSPASRDRIGALLSELWK